MRAHTLRTLRVLLAAVAALSLAGCHPSRDLWQRWRAEKMLWQARQDDAEARDGHGSDVILAAGRETAMLEAVIAAFPPAEWTSEAAWRRPIARDVARLSATAALLRAEVDERDGRDLAAELRYQRIASDFGRMDSVTVLASAGRARCLERIDRLEDSQAAWLQLAARDPATGPGGAARRTVLEAADEAARMLELLGQKPSADSLRRVAAGRIEAAAAALGRDSAATELRVAASALLAGAGDEAAARAELVRALDTAGSPLAQSVVLLALVDRCRVAALPETARIYAARLRGAPRPNDAWEADLMVAHAWEAAGVADSALAVYKRLVESLPEGSELSARARLARALELERLGRWEIARAELRTLSTLYPSHECGLTALVRVVRHSVEEGDNELAAVEARHAQAEIDELLASQGDADVRLRVHRARAELLSLQGHAAEASRELWSVWTLDPRRAGAVEAGWLAARLADSALADTARAHMLYSDLARQTIDLDVRREARQRLVAAER